MDRRTLLKAGGVGVASLALLGGGAAILFEPAWRDDRLSRDAQSLAAAVARCVLDGTLPEEPTIRSAAISAHLERMNATVHAMAPATQAQIAGLLAILVSPPGRWAIAGLKDSWDVALTVDIQRAMQAMRTSRLLFRRQVYQALRDLTHAAYFADIGTWPRLGYPGPVALT
jgi:hypothetical protein